MDMDFTSFLSRMGNETSGNKKIENLNEDISESDLDYFSEPKRNPKKQKIQKEEYQEPEDINEDYEDEEPENHSSNKKVINEEFLDKAYDYAQGVVKVIRNNFKTTEEKVVMLESLQKAINYYLSNLGIAPQQQSYQPSTPRPQATMSESEWNNMPVVTRDQVPGTVRMNDLTGVEVKMPVTTGDYNPRLNLGIKIGPDGKQEADLSRITQNDINEMKVLAGMVGPEAERRNEELKAAKIALQDEIARKKND